MWLFRKSLDVGRATPRPVCVTDLTAVSRLLRDATRRYYGLNGSDLPGLVEAGYGAVLDANGEIYAAVVTSQPAEDTCWLRAVAFADGVEPRVAAAVLFPALHAALAAKGVRHSYYAGDEAADAWLIPLLKGYGYYAETEVIVYEKSQLDVPDQGNLAVQLRPATQADLPQALSLDQRCFEPQWTKDDTVLGPAIDQGAYFVVAELAQKPVGYAFATSHFHGRLVHLVRIAVAPEYRSERIGVRLLADVIAYAVEQQANLVTLNTQAYNIQAQRLYRWFGFTVSGERQTILRCNFDTFSFHE